MKGFIRKFVSFCILVALFPSETVSLEHVPEELTTNRIPDDYSSQGSQGIAITSRGSSGYLNQDEDETEVGKKHRLVSAQVSENGGGLATSAYGRFTTKSAISQPIQPAAGHENNSVKTWKKLRRNGNQTTEPPPPPSQVARMARYVVKTSDWSTMATISSRDDNISAGSKSPFANVVSISDGPADKSTGVPYMYVTAKDLSVQDLEVNPRMSLSVTLAQSHYCSSMKYDPEDPRCARVILTGEFVKLTEGSDEAAFAKLAVFSRHPVMASWPADHKFFFAKLEIEKVYVLDYFGGAKIVLPKEYFKARP